MRSRTKNSVSVRAIHAHAATLVETHLKIRDHGPKCRASVLIAILFFAASRMRSVFDACQRLADAPSDQAVRDALVARLPALKPLERRINAGLSAELPRSLTKRPQRVAFDVTLFRITVSLFAIRRKSTALSPRAAPRIFTPTRVLLPSRTGSASPWPSRTSPRTNR